MKKSILKIAALLVCLLITVFPLTACGGSGSPDNNTSSNVDNAGSEVATLVGSWEYESGGFTYTFNEDGTGNYDAGGTEMEFTYTDNGDSVEILYTGNTTASTFEYTISGDTLTIKDSFGEEVVYKKK